MSITDILSSARSGLSAAQAALGTVSNNIANVGTAGYAREQVNLSTGAVQGRVSGVVVGEPTRVANQFLEDTVYRRAGDAGRYEAESTYMDRLQALLGQPGAEGGIPARMDAIASSAIAMTGLSNSPQTVAAFTSNVQDTIQSLQNLSNDSHQLQSDVEAEVGFTVDKINGLLSRIHDLNGTISQLTGLRRSTSGVEDQRMQAVEELSGLVNVTVRHQPDGRMSIDSADGTVLLDKRLRQLDYPMSGQGVSQTTYPQISVHFTDVKGNMGADTGQVLGGAASGGALGGLINMRDRVIPQFQDDLGRLYGGLSEALNSASNSATAMPPPVSLTGRETGLVGTDRLGFTGSAQFAVTDKSGNLIASTTVDFDALGPGATINDAVAAINTGLGGNATASLSATGVLTFQTGLANAGVSIGQGSPTPSDRAGVGFSQYFGMNDLVKSADSALVPAGFVASDPHGFGTGETAHLDLRDANGRIIASADMTGTTGSTIGDLVNELNASPIGQFGSFSLDNRGRFAFAPIATASGSSLSIPSDSTNRMGTGRSFTELSGLNGSWSGLATAGLRQDIASDPGRMPLATLQSGVAVGARALGSGDVSGASRLVDALNSTLDITGKSKQTVARYTSNIMGGIGTSASLATSRMGDASARKSDAVNRRDSFSGVNLDEELSQMVLLQNSYSAAARVLTTASQMYDTLISMMR